MRIFPVDRERFVDLEILAGKTFEGPSWDSHTEAVQDLGWHVDSAYTQYREEKRKGETPTREFPPWLEKLCFDTWEWLRSAIKPGQEEGE